LKEKEIRDRIQGFLKRTARTVVVPASVGLGLSAGACDRTSLHGRPADAAGTLSTSDAAVVSPDAADAASDLALGADLPELVPPYLVMMVPDARPDVQPIDGAPDARPDAQPDLASPPPPYMDPPIPDAGRDAQPDAQPDLATPPPPYMVPPIPDAGREMPAIVPPYIVPSPSAPPSPGGTAPVPPKENK
jgi:hypothetical protein